MRAPLLFALTVATVLLLACAGTAAAQGRPHSDCSYCHNLHGSGTGGVPLTAYNKDVDLCLSCHDAGAPPTYDGKVVPKGVTVHDGAKHAPTDTTTCTDCHGHYGETSGNLALVPRSKTSRYPLPTGEVKTVVFTARSGPNSFADGDGTYDGMCEVCHTQTDFHRGNAAGNHGHEAGQTCTNCHAHSDRFKGDCQAAGCHEAGGTYDPLITGGTGTAGKHVVHVTDKGQACTVCHSGYYSAATHRDGTLNGKTDEIGPIGFNGLNPTATYTDASQSAGTGTCAQVNCHRPDAVDWYDPGPSPIWSMPNGCNTCHNAGDAIDPLTVAATGTAGKHARHVTDMGVACGSCHAGYLTAYDHVNGRMDAGDSNAVVGFKPAENPNALWQSDTGYRTGSCASTWCHGATDGVTSVANEPTWYEATAALACTDCHSAGSFTDPLTINDTGAAGKHVTHVTDRGYVCTRCHLDYDTAATHVNFSFDTGTSAVVSFDAANPYASWSTGAASCARTYCHGATDDNVSVANNVPTWYTTTPLACTDCHSRGSPDSFLDPITRDNTGSYRGEHDKHVRGENIACTVCHGAYTQQPTHGNLDELDSWDPATMLLDFDPLVSSPNAGDPPAAWTSDTGPGTGRCDQLCHYPGRSKNHSNWRWY